MPGKVSCFGIAARHSRTDHHNQTLWQIQYNLAIEYPTTNVHVYTNVCIIINITTIIILCIYFCIPFIPGIIHIPNVIAFSYLKITHYIKVQLRRFNNMQMCVLNIKFCYLYTSTIIIICTYLPLYIFQFSILHIPNNILSNNTHWITVQLRRSN